MKTWWNVSWLLLISSIAISQNIILINFTAFCENEHKRAFFLAFYCDRFLFLLKILLLSLELQYWLYGTFVILKLHPNYILRCKYLNWYFIISKNNLYYQKNNIVILLTIVQVRMQNKNENKNWFGLDFTVSQINNFSFTEDIIIL